MSYVHYWRSIVTVKTVIKVLIFYLNICLSVALDSLLCPYAVLLICRPKCEVLLKAWFITGFRTRLARRVPLVEKELFTLPEHLSSSPSFSGVRATRSLLLCVVFCSSLFVLSYFFLLTIVLSVLLRYTDSDYPFGIFKLFLLIFKPDCY